MSYPISNIFTQHHAAFFTKRFGTLLNICVLAASTLLAVAAFCSSPVKYRISGIILMDHNREIKDTVLKKQSDEIPARVAADLRKFIADSGVRNEDADCQVFLQDVGNNIIVDWQLDFHDRIVADRVLKKYSSRIWAFNNDYPQIEFAHRATPKIVLCREWDSAIVRGISGCISGVFIGLLIGFLISILILEFDRRIIDLRQFEADSGLNILGVLPEVSKGVPDLAEDRYFRSAIRSLLLNIQFSKTTPGRALVLMVSSLEQRNGASTVVRSLSRQFAEVGNRVLVVRGEYSKKLTAIKCKRKDNVAVNGKESFFYKDDSSGTDFSGIVDCIVYEKNRSCSVSSDVFRQMEQLLMEKSAVYDYVFIDAPEAQGSSEPLLIGSLADQVLLVCDSRLCSRYLLQVILWRLRKANIRIGGCVINHFPLHRQRKDYDFYQHFFYHYRQ